MEYMMDDLLTTSDFMPANIMGTKVWGSDLLSVTASATIDTTRTRSELDTLTSELNDADAMRMRVPPELLVNGVVYETTISFQRDIYVDPNGYNVTILIRDQNGHRVQPMIVLKTDLLNSSSGSTITALQKHIKEHVYVKFTL